MIRAGMSVLTLAVACAPVANVKPPAFDPASPVAHQDAEALVHHHLQNGERMLGVEDLVVRSTQIDSLGIAHTRLDQHLGGVPVFGAQAIVHVPSNGASISMTDGLNRDVQVDTRPRRTQDEALAIAKEAFGGLVHRADADLQILRHEGRDHLTWRVQQFGLLDHEPQMPVHFVDAHDGSVVWSYDNLQTARHRETHDANSDWVLPGTLARSELDAPILDDEVDNAHDFAGLAYDYYDTFQGRDSWDAQGATITSVVHYGAAYNNAFWNGQHLVYGDGSAGTFDPLSNALDVVAHEFTHAVTGRSASLIYANESGGLNEATSDIMAAVIEGWNDGWVVNVDTWNVGEDVTQFATALRYMADPTSDGRSIDDYDDYTPGMGVHSSSGIANRAFVEWESDVDVSLEEAGAIWYRGLLYYMSPTTTFPEARLATEQAAIDLFGEGSIEHQSVSAGWDLVDVPAGKTYEVFQTVTVGAQVGGAQPQYVFSPHPEATAVRFTVEGTDGDADLYVRFGSAPTTSLYDCRSHSADSYEICTFDPLQSGNYHAMIDVFSAFSGATIRAWQACEDADGDGFSICAGDCDDTNADIHPDVPELCNDIDDNCDESTDGPDSIDATTWYADTDTDGFGDAASSTISCLPVEGFVEDATDCDDTRDDIHPEAPEVCDDLDTDEDCDGVGDEPDDAQGVNTYLRDRDADGFGDDASPVASCQQDEGLVDVGGDCADEVPEVNPAADEICDELDNDCNGQIDDNPVDGIIFYVDADRDGFGVEQVVACEAPPGTATQDGDCDDTNPAAYPGSDEVPEDGVDQDCDGADPQLPEPPVLVGPAECGCSGTGSTGLEAWMLAALVGVLLRRR